MNRRLILMFFCFALACVFGIGCATGPDKKDSGLTGEAGRVPVFFKQIPAQTPYIWTSIEPFPMEVMEPFLRLYGDVAQQTRLSLEDSGMGGNSDDPFVRFMLAMLDEMDGVQGMEGYERLGFSTRAQMAFYGIGWFPVFRMTLGDADAFNAMLERIEGKAGWTPQIRTIEGVSFRQYNLGEDDFKVAVSVVDDQFVIGGAPTAAFDEFVAYMLGVKSVGRSMADVQTMQQIRARHGFNPYAVGYFDIAGTVKVLGGAAPADPVTANMLQSIDFEPSGWNEACRREYVELAEGAPRVVFGYTVLTAELMDAKAVLEIEGDFARQLAAISAPIPGKDSAVVDEAFLALGIGIDMQKSMDFIRTQSNRILSAPYQCEDLAFLNEMAEGAPNAMAMIPPVVTSLRGMLSVMTNMDMNAGIFEGLALVQTSDPMALFSTISQFIPELQNVQVKPDGLPVAVPPIAGTEEFVNPQLAMSSQLLGASVGAGMEATLGSMIKAVPPPGSSTGLLVFLAYDYGEFMKQLNAMSGGYSDDPATQSIEMLSQIMGRFVAGLAATEEGLEMHYRVTMHPERVRQPVQ